MKTLKLAEVEKFTGVHRMTAAQAAKYVSPHQLRQHTKNQALALSLMTRLNTPEDWLRLQACLVHLSRRRA